MAFINWKRQVCDMDRFNMVTYDPVRKMHI